MSDRHLLKRCQPRTGSAVCHDALAAAHQQLAAPDAPGLPALQRADQAGLRAARLSRALPTGRGGWHDEGVDYLLAQVNIGRMLAPLGSTRAPTSFNAATISLSIRHHTVNQFEASRGGRLASRRHAVLRLTSPLVPVTPYTTSVDVNR